MTPYDRQGELVSATGQLRWRERRGAAGGCFTMDTPGTKAVVGFAAGRRCELGDVTIEPRSRFGAIYVTAREPDKTIATSRELLVVAIARARNTGMKVSPDGALLLAPGKGPVLMEPVQTRITIAKPGTPTVIVLDHDGKPTARTLPLDGGAFEIDGARDKTAYYLIRY